MKIITIAALKGGVGKTNVCFNLAGLLAKDYKVLLIDCDPQANLTINCGIDTAITSNYTIKDIFEDNEAISNVIQDTAIPSNNGIKIITSDIFLYQTESKLVTRAARETILQRYIKKNKAVFESFDYILLDVNPSFNIINQNAFLISDSILLISDISLNSIQGIELFIALWEDIRSNFDKEDNIKAVLLNNADKRLKLYKELVEYCKDSSIANLLLDTTIFNNVRLKETEIEHKPIDILYPNSISYKIYKDLKLTLKKKGVL